MTATRAPAISASLAPLRSRRTEIRFRPGEQAVPDLAVGGKPDPVTPRRRTVSSHRRNNADRVAQVADHPRGASSAGAAATGSAHPLDLRSAGPMLAEALRDLGCSDHVGALPAPVLWIQRHLLDEPELDPLGHSPAQQVESLMIIDAAHQHSVDLDRVKAGQPSSRDSGEHIGQSSASAEPDERIRIKSVQRDVDPAQARRGQLLRARGQANRVCRQT